ncbi:MAG TPA: helix-turn-helix domain-containing protein [Trebonia sp.]|nr:helix-turn-helix domain-containing protein [Trebonia sp.]
MGRVAGVTSAETRARLLRAAADEFAARGYDGTRVADIAAAAGVSNGALYAHFGSKAELLVAALRAHGGRILADMLAAEPDRPVADMLLQAGRMLPRHPDDRSYLGVEALIAARRHADVATPMRGYTSDHASWLAGLVEAGQASGELDASLSPEAVAHFCLLLGFGSSLLTDELHAVDEAEWSALLERVVAALLPTAAGYRERQVAGEGARARNGSEVAHGRTQEPDGCAS